MKRSLYPVLAFLVESVCFCDTIVLKNGTAIEGSLVNMDAREIALNRCGRVEYFAKDEVNSIQVRPVAGAGLCASAPSKLELPSGLAIRVRMAEHVDSLREPRGQIFLATLEEPVTIDGRIVVPQGGRMLVELIELGDAIWSLNLVAIERRKSSWMRLDGRTSTQPSTAAKIDAKDLRADRILVPTGTLLTFVLQRALTIEP